MTAKSPIPSWFYMLLIAPFGAVTGYVGVALAFELARRGFSTEAIAALTAWCYLPHTWKFLWAPAVDLLATRRTWYLISTAATAAGIVGMSVLAVDSALIGWLTVVAVLTNLTSTFSGMAVESLMAHATPDSHRGRVAGWFQAGNLGGGGVGGGLALWLVQSQGLSMLAAASALALACLLCGLPLLRLREPAAESTAQVDVGPERSMVAHLAHLWRDLWSVMRSRAGLLAMAVCFLPIGSGGVTNLWAAVAGDWQASANTVAMVNGALGGLIAATGCVLGGTLSDRMPRRVAYCVFGAVQALLALAMSLAPATETWFIVFSSAYAFALGMTYAAFSGVVLEAIGRGAAATKYNLLASLSNIPTAYVTFIDGWVHTRHGAPAMLQTEAALGFVGLILFIAVSMATARMKSSRPSPSPSP